MSATTATTSRDSTCNPARSCAHASASATPIPSSAWSPISGPGNGTTISCSRSRPFVAGIPPRTCSWWAPAIPITAAPPCAQAVCTNVGGNTELVREGESGFLVAPGDIAALAERISFVLLHPELAASMGRKAREAAEQFTVGRMADAYMDVYRRLAS
ncbi:MAG: hypothetical protein DMF87_06120 [Acidobacteria bacterium]|nr:MAG: hypothetical protein DMF87_06120 [Acidobacteriota bacterium]